MSGGGRSLRVDQPLNHPRILPVYPVFEEKSQMDQTENRSSKKIALKRRQNNIIVLKFV